MRLQRAKLDAELGGGLADHEHVHPQLAPSRVPRQEFAPWATG
jgi:hypothetical protein